MLMNLLIFGLQVIVAAALLLIVLLIAYHKGILRGALKEQLDLLFDKEADPWK